jgi:glycerophosphoryl diester phosphodiesterase
VTGSVGKIALASESPPFLRQPMAVRPLRIAHRGMPRRERENTLRSFAAALSAGADGIELDVHATADGVVVVHHDPHIVGGTAIARTPWRELRQAGAERGVEIPTLADVCELVNDHADLFVEIKGAGIERQVVAVLADHHGPSAIHSFDHAAIRRLWQLDPRLRLGLLFEERVPDVAAMLADHGALDAWPNYSVVDRSLVDAVHGAGGRVIAWTVNDQRDIARLAALEVDGVCTDDVSLVAAR